MLGIAAPFASNMLLERQPNGDNHLFTAEEIQQFKDDPEFYYNWRKDLETEMNVRFMEPLLLLN